MCVVREIVVTYAAKCKTTAWRMREICVYTNSEGIIFCVLTVTYMATLQNCELTSVTFNVLGIIHKNKSLN